MDQVKLFKGCLPQILFSLFLNTFSHMVLKQTIIYYQKHCSVGCSTEIELYYFNERVE